MTSGSDITQNLEDARNLIKKAALNGAQLAVLPELFPISSTDKKELLAIAEEDGNGPIQEEVRKWTKDYGITVAGSIPLKSEEPDHIYNSCLVIDRFGNQLARYDKIHLFEYSTDHEQYKESNLYKAGKEPVYFTLPLDNGIDINVGLAVCYDLRFPELFRNLQTPDLIILPAAFTFTTGKAHWDILVRARAIENLCYFAAAGQAGINDQGRRCWGHSCVINPWGQVLSELDEEENGVCYGTLNTNFITQVRTSLPAVKQRSTL